MFTRFFKMTSQPFTERISVSQVLHDERMSQALARLLYMACHGTIALIAGPTGVGKSTLIKLFLDNLPHNHYKPLYIHFTHVRASSLFKLIVTELGEIPKLTKERLFLQVIDKVNKNNLTHLLILDEAHLLNNNALVDLRLLVSSALDETPPLKIILSGQEELLHKLKRGAHKDFAQRISVCCHLKPLSSAQTSAYIDFQMKYSGASDKVFQQEVKEMIHEYSSGIPRQINNIATGCLINASITKCQTVNLDLLNQTMAEFQLF
jgi:general secretion pathway protein A